VADFPWTPLLSERDDVDSAEGGVDPLGTEPIAETLGVTLCPGVRERQLHPRFLTALAVSLSLCEEIPDDRMARDGITPPWLVFEWYVVEGLVREFWSDTKAIAGLPGRNKAADAVGDGVPLSARRYLKTPTVFGFQGIYRQLARNLRIEQDGRLGENGYELLSLWASEQGLTGFAGSKDGHGKQIRQRLLDALLDGLDKGSVARGGGWAGWSFFAEHLAPYDFGRREKRFLVNQLLTSANGGFREEVLRFLVSPRGHKVWRARNSERDFHAALAKHAGVDLGRLLRAIDRYERFSRLLQDAFEECLFEITCHNRRTRRVSTTELGALECVKRATKEVPRIFGAVEEALSPFGNTAAEFREQFEALGRNQNSRQWAEALMALHKRVQEDKPPDGKRPWVEIFDDQTFRCRPLYLQDAPPARDDRYVHLFRTSPLWSFARDLRMLS
jgi:hypothetical protein